MKSGGKLEKVGNKEVTNKENMNKKREKKNRERDNRKKHYQGKKKCIEGKSVSVLFRLKSIYLPDFGIYPGMTGITLVWPVFNSRQNKSISVLAYPPVR